MPQQQWFGRLRGQIKDRCGVGWGIADRNGDTQLTRRINDGKQHENPRQSVQLGMPWNPADIVNPEEVVRWVFFDRGKKVCEFDNMQAFMNMSARLVQGAPFPL